MQPFKVCVDQIPPEPLEAAQRSITENPANAVFDPQHDGIPATETHVDSSDGFGGTGTALAVTPMPPALAAETGKMWQVGRTLRVRFLNGDSAIQQKVVHHAKQWLSFADIDFNFGNDANAEIRIDLGSDGQSWSHIGTDCLSVPANQATMHYGWLTKDTADDEFNRTVVHEFGHALGCFHEHQNPAGDIQWNKEAVYRYYEGPPNNWTKAQVDNNLFAKYDKNISQYSALDPTSIMMYPIPPEFTTNGFTVGWNRQLSPMDKQYIQRWYPPYQVRINMTSQEYQATFTDLTSKGFRVSNVSGYSVGGQERYAATFTKTPIPGMSAWQARHGMTGAQYQQAFDSFTGQGYRLLDVSGYQVGGEAHYAAVWVKAPGPAFQARHGLTADQYQQTFNQMTAQGFRLVHVNGYGVNGQAFYAAIWEKNNGTPFVARHGLSATDYQAAFNQYTGQGYRLMDVCGYAVGNQTLYAGVWAKVAGPGYIARHSLSRNDFIEQNKQNQLQGFEPVRVSGYTTGNSETYAGIWQALL